MEILAKKRDLKINPKKYRDSGSIPGIIFSKKSSHKLEETTPIIVDIKDFTKLYREAGESTLITINLENEPAAAAQALISEVQKHPISLNPLHVSFYQVDLTQEIDANIPIKLLNEDDHPKVKSTEAIILALLSEIEVRCLPQNLPSEFLIDTLLLKEIGDVLSIKNAIKYDSSKIEILTDLDEVLVKLDYAEQLEVEDTDAPESIDQVEVLKKGKLEDADDPDDSEEENKS